MRLTVGLMASGLQTRVTIKALSRDSALTEPHLKCGNDPQPGDMPQALRDSYQVTGDSVRKPSASDEGIGARVPARTDDVLDRELRQYHLLRTIRPKQFAVPQLAVFASNLIAAFRGRVVESGVRRLLGWIDHGHRAPHAGVAKRDVLLLMTGAARRGADVRSIGFGVQKGAVGERSYGE